MDHEVACERIDQAIRSLLEAKKALKQPVDAKPEVQPDDEDLGDFATLKSVLGTIRWPEAVNPSLVCNPNSDNDKAERGYGVIELLVQESVKGKRFLDYGCGEGHCAKAAQRMGAAYSVGFDIKTSEQWNSNSTKFTSSLDELKQMEPFDIILLFDVIDHLTQDDPTTILKNAASLLAPQGKIYMRCHPWVSRHGSHLYHQLNKAYAHLVFTPAELKELVPDPAFKEPNLNVVYPIKTYDTFVSNAGLEVVSRDNIVERVEPFFKAPKIAERITRNTSSAYMPEYQMTIQFVDYVLTKKPG